MQDRDNQDAIRNTIDILKLICHGEEDVNQGRTKSQKKVFASIEKLLTEKSEQNHHTQSR